MNLLEKSICENNKIGVILFDFGGVLSEEGWKKGLRIIAEANALNADSFIQTAADTVYETGFITGKGSEIDFWNTLKKKTGIKGDNASLTNELMSRFLLLLFSFLLKHCMKVANIGKNQPTILNVGCNN